MSKSVHLFGGLLYWCTDKSMKSLYVHQNHVQKSIIHALCTWKVSCLAISIKSYKSKDFLVPCTLALYLSFGHPCTFYLKCTDIQAFWSVGKEFIIKAAVKMGYIRCTQKYYSQLSCTLSPRQFHCTPQKHFGLCKNGLRRIINSSYYHLPNPVAGCRRWD